MLNKIHCGDNVELIKKIEDNKIDLTVTSPPYGPNVRSYKGGVAENEYGFNLELIPELYRVTADGGVVVWVVGDATIAGSESGISFKTALKFMEAGFLLHDTMIYEKNSSSFPAKRDGVRYSQIFEYMFVFSKGKVKTHNLICDKANRWAGWTAFGTGSQRTGENNELVKYDKKPTPDFSPRNNIWRYSTGKNYSTTDAIAHEHSAIFPEALAHDHIITWSNEGDTVLDPFNGSGTTTKMSRILKRNFIGLDFSRAYCDIAEKRLLIDDYIVEKYVNGAPDTQAPKPPKAKENVAV